MLKLHLQLSSQRKRLYQEAIRRLQHVCVCDEGSPDGRIVGPEDISGEHPTGSKARSKALYCSTVG